MSVFWSDWFFIDDNDYLAEFGDDSCERIALDYADAPWGTFVEVLETEIVKIEKAKNPVIFQSMLDSDL